MRLSSYFLPTLRENPAEAQIISHRYMLRAGLIHQTMAGVYSWLPLGLRVLQKIQTIIREEHDRRGFHEVLMPTVQPAELWRRSGRYEDYGKEMLRIKDRHDRELLYGPTNEEVITDIFAHYIKSYRHVPQVLYQIQWKFRDEIRPRFGVMRGREFLMKDAYSFDMDFNAACQTYEKFHDCYLQIFARMGLTAIPVKADPGAIGGKMSQEFQIMAETGESTVYYDEAFDHLTFEQKNIAHMRHLYAAADEMHNPETCPIPESRLKSARGIEVGHIFYFGKKYSEPLGAKVLGPDGKPVIMEMGSYGIGVSRLVGAIIEASHDERGIIWPEPVAPFHIGLINARPGDSMLDSLSDYLYGKLSQAGFEVLYDDRSERAGEKFADMDLIGVPYQIIVGKQTLEKGTFEFKVRQTGERLDLTEDGIFKRLGRQ